MLSSANASDAAFATSSGDFEYFRSTDPFGASFFVSLKYWQAVSDRSIKPPIPYSAFILLMASPLPYFLRPSSVQGPGLRERLLPHAFFHPLASDAPLLGCGGLLGFRRRRVGLRRL